MSGEEDAPKKIALKVPSLFIKSSAKESDNETPPKPARPMPASVRKKMEEAKLNDTASTVSSSSSTDGSVTQKKVARAMPASARRKLEEGDKNLDGANWDAATTLSPSSMEQEKSKKSSKPMPASVRNKLMRNSDSREKSELEENDSSSKELSIETDQVKKLSRAMPASARRKLETNCDSKSETGSEKDSRENVTVNGDHEPKKVAMTEQKSRPMPASARRQVEDKKNDKMSEKTEMDVQEETKNDSSSKNETKVKPRAMPASARRKLEDANKTINDDAETINDISTKTNDDANSGDALLDQTLITANNVTDDETTWAENTDDKPDPKKINISLGGIKFPTFKKPMPASAKRKAEEKLVDSDNTMSKDDSLTKDDSNWETTMEETEEEGEEGYSSRSSRRGRSSTQNLLSLDSKTFSCEICGYEFYQAFKMEQHMKSKHGQNKEEDKSNVTKKAPSKSTNPTTKKSTKKPPKKSKYQGMKACPYCDRPFSSWKKIAPHAAKCKQPANLACSYCDKKFRNSRDLESHVKTHEKVQKKDEDPMPIPLTSNDLSDDAAASPTSSSVDSKSSRKSIVVQPRPMPRSIKEKHRKENPTPADEKVVSDTTNLEAEPSKGAQSFKRKIADVLSTLGNRRFNKPDDEEEGPPRKKIKGEGNKESIKSHPMPASAKKKLQDKGPKDQDDPDSSSSQTPIKSTPKSEDLDDLDDLECEVCHRFFGHYHNRLRHEKTVHGIENPRQKSRTGESTTPSTPDPPTPKETTPASKLDLNSIAKFGTCPICTKFIKNDLRRHVRDTHKLPVPKATIKLSSAHRPSYTIYKSATNKLKQKLATVTGSGKKPAVTVDKSIPVSSINKDKTVKADIKSKVIATTASSELRCACCDKIFEVQCDFYEHMTMKHSESRRLVTCKLCDHRFSHEEDFLLHIQFKHQSQVGNMIPKSDKDRNSSPPRFAAAKKNVTKAKTTRKSAVDARVYNAHVNISQEDRKRAEIKLNKPTKREDDVITSSVKSISSRSTRRSSIRPKSPEPKEESYEDNDNSFDDHHFEDDEPMEIEESGIAITSTFSQKVPSPQKASSAAVSVAANDSDAMPCSACNEIFYTYEALRKHELYFHNVKTTKMCPICGVYPTRLSRHLLAHENKTVRCSCVPCRLSFPEFSQLLKHNLEKHPGVDGGAQSAPNKPADGKKEDKEKSDDDDCNDSDMYQCLLCKREFSEAKNLRRHIRRSHPENEVNVENLIERVRKSDRMGVDEEVETILKDTNKKLSDPDWDSDCVAEEPVAAPPPPPNKTSRPMPASARARLQKQADINTPIENKIMAVTLSVVSGSSTSVGVKSGGRPMPASVRAKLEAQRSQQTSDADSSKESKPPIQAKPARPMPASVRAKLMSQTNSTPSPSNSNSRDSSVSSSSSKPRRPMPASIRAKLGIRTDDDAPRPEVEVMLESAENTVTKPSEEDIIVLDDDVDDQVDDAMPEPEPEEPAPAPTFSTTSEEEHDKAVRMAMGGTQPRKSDFSFTQMFQCKLCNKKFETADTTRRHIQRCHSEYDPDLAENLIAQLFDEYAHTPRRRTRTNVRYTEDDDDDEEEEVIINRGTSRRPKKNVDKDWTDTESFNDSDSTPIIAQHQQQTLHTMDVSSDVFACKFCGQRKDSAANVRRHISKAHPHLTSQRDSGVVLVESGSNQDFVDLPPPPAPVVSRAAPTSKPAATPKAGNPFYVCKICSKCMPVRSSLYVHIIRYHPEVEKGTAPHYIQELNGSGTNTASPAPAPEVAPAVEVEPEPQTATLESDNSFYCSICSYQTNDESDYVRHYKGHTGVSPYQCQYCSATFNRQQQLNAHITREHTGAEFLTNDEPEISMEEVVTSNQISVETASKIQIETTSQLSARRESSESNGHSTENSVSNYRPGPASRKPGPASRKPGPASTKPGPASRKPGPASRKPGPACKTEPTPKPDEDEMDIGSSPPNSPPAPAPASEDKPDEPDNMEVNEAVDQQEEHSFSYQGDLSSLFPTLGGGAAPGGIDALDDIDGGMSLD